MHRLSILPALALLASGAVAQITDSDVPRDQARGRWMNFEVGLLEPFEFHPDGDIVYLINQPGNRLVFMDRVSKEPQLEVPLGLGLASVHLRPGTNELWCVDTVMSTVSIVNAVNGEIRRSLRVGAEPHGLVFGPGGDRAYVTCSAARQVDVIDAATFEVAKSIPIPAREPRDITRVGDRVYVVPLISGNGTAPLGDSADFLDTLDVVGVARTEGEDVTPLPDRDVFVIQLGASADLDVLDESVTLSGVGTNLFSIVQRPGTNELWIPHTEALNAEHQGEVNFVAGQVVRNRISVVDASDMSLLRIIDLDDLAPSPDVNCSAPTDVTFTSDGSRAFVCGYGSDAVAVLDVDAQAVPTWRGIVRIRIESTYPDGAGPRVSRLDLQEEHLWIQNKGDLSLSRVTLADLPSAPDFVHFPPKAEEYGWDPTPADINQGRVHFIRTRNSASMTSSCNSCHLDGYHDGLVWDLSHFLDDEGTETPAFPLDHKGPMVTHSLRHLREVGPYHWRGERKDLFEFDSTFPNLLERHNDEGQLEGLRDDFRYITQFMEHLALLPNPKQNLDRTYSAEQLEGADLFLNKPVLGDLTCVDCHALPLGTSGEIVSTRDGGLAPTAVVPQLRQVSSKLTPAFHVGGAFGVRNELGAGLNHGGEAPTLVGVMMEPLQDGAARFDLTLEEAEKIATFLEVLDTGLAPAAAYQVTAHAGNLADFEANTVPFLLDQIQEGNCDVVFRYGPITEGGEVFYRTGTFDRASGLFRQATETLPDLSFSDLTALAANRPVTFLGVPVLMGKPMGIDRDNDKILDRDEVALGTDPEWDDSDGDTFPDGYEVLWGTNPLVSNNGAAIPDAQPPQLEGPVRQVYVTTNAVKLEFETNEVTRVIFFVDGTAVLRAPLFPKHDTEFSEILSMLEPGRTYEIELWMTDPRGNLNIASTSVTTRDLVQEAPAHVAAIELTTLPGASGTYLRAEVDLVAGDDGAGPAYSVLGKVYHRAMNGHLTLIADPAQIWSDYDSKAIFYVPLPADLPALGELVFMVENAPAPPGRVPYAEGNDVVSHAVLPL